MTDQGEEKYFEAGKLALALCKKYLGEVRPNCIVDFPSGYGRALRWFRNEWRSAEIFAVETDERALGFVRSHFNAIPLISDANLRVSLPGNVDLIFCGSLLTHFDEWPWDIFFDKCVLSLEVDGCLIFTVHGRTHASLVKDNPKFFGEGIDGKIIRRLRKVRFFLSAIFGRLSRVWHFVVFARMDFQETTKNILWKDNRIRGTGLGARRHCD